jgi:hypothetical protein
MQKRDEATTFLNFIFRNCPDGTGNINLRHKDPAGKVRDIFISLDHIEEIPPLLSDDSDFWFGVALRNGNNGKREGISLIPAFHLDHDDLTPEIEQEILSFLPPSAIVQTSSNTHKQYFWLLKEPADGKDYVKIETINYRLLKRFGGDPGTWDASRVLRVPGTINHKYPDRPVCKLLEMNPTHQYQLSDFDILPEATLPSNFVSKIEIKNISQSWERAKREISRHPRVMLHLMTPKPEDRSGHDWRLTCLCVEEGIVDPELLYQIILQNPHGKAQHYPGTQKYIEDLISRCFTQFNVNLESPGENPTEDETKEKELSFLNLNLPSSLEISRLEIKVVYLVQNLIPKESITLLHSIGGVGKTYLMYALGKAVSDGEPFFSLDVTKENVYYIDFENPLPEISDRMKRIGGSENFKIWHLAHDPMPIRFDDGYEIYKTFPPGLFIIDSLRSSHLMEENSSKDAAFIMARIKEIRALGNTVILIHHENKLGGYRGSTAWFDLSDHILKFSRVKKIGSDEDTDEDNFDLPVRLGLGGKSRFSSAMELKPMFFRFENNQLCQASDPNDDILGKMADLLNPSNPPTQAEFQKLVKDNLDIGKDKFRNLLKMGENRSKWYAQKSITGNKFEYRRV